MRRWRLEEIFEASAFQCHKTVDYDEYDDDHLRQGDHPQQCVGLMTVLHRENRPNQIMQVADRFGELNADELDPDNEAYSSFEEVFKAHHAD